MTTRYINPFASPRNHQPVTRETDADPVRHAGCLIFRRGWVYDVVVNGVCVRQRFGLRGAKEAAEAVAREMEEARVEFAAQEVSAK